jgi:hypothetical protein
MMMMGQQSIQYYDIRFVNEFAPKFPTIAANVSMSCPISSTSGGIDYRVVLYATNVLQNSGGGIALVNPSNVAIEFLSYEGVVSALSGPAQGQSSTNVVVSEVGEEPIGRSLQRCPNNLSLWTGPIVETPGAQNVICPP